MIDLFYMGGPLFMGILTIIFFSWMIFAVLIFLNKSENESTFLNVQRVFDFGLLAFVVGVMGQFLGLYQMFEAVERMGNVSPALLMGGLKVSSVTTMYGLLQFVLAIIVKQILIWYKSDK
ncbi:hypothetical protein EP331_08235 [bacterium]|nr:MAG: hypothetical protein EP331_08235 [bacterium]